MGDVRRSRGVRPPARGYRLTKRDLEILYAVGRFKYATSDHVTRLFFKSQRTAARRLMKLNALSCLTVTVTGLAETNLYTLSPKGLTLLETAGEDTARLHQGKQPKRRADVEHLLAINDLRVALHETLPNLPDVTLEAFEVDHDLRRAAGARPPPFIPDALIAVRVGSGESRGLVVEVDLGTEPTTFIARSKGRCVRDLWRARAACWGLPFPWAVLIMAPSMRRLRGIALALHQDGAADGWFGMPLGSMGTTDFLSSPVMRLASLALHPSSPAPVLFRDLLTCRYEVT